MFRATNNSASLSWDSDRSIPLASYIRPRVATFVCFEPMAALTNAFNLAHAGLYPNLQHVEPGNTWEEEFWIQPGVQGRLFDRGRNRPNGS